GSSQRYHTALFQDGNIYDVWFDPTLGRQTQLLGQAKAGTTYVVEVATSAASSTLYVYEASRDRARGLTSTRAIGGWSTARTLLRTTGQPGQTSNSLRVDNLSEASVAGRLIGRGLIASESAGDLQTQYVYDDQNRRIATILPDGSVDALEY